MNQRYNISLCTIYWKAVYFKVFKLSKQFTWSILRHLTHSLELFFFKNKKNTKLTNKKNVSHRNVSWQPLTCLSTFSQDLQYWYYWNILLHCYLTTEQQQFWHDMCIQMYLFLVLQTFSCHLEVLFQFDPHGRNVRDGRTGTAPLNDCCPTP